jgi:hypothetical protein
MADTTDTLTVRFGRLPRHGVLLGLSALQITCLSLASAIAVPAMFTAGTRGATLTLPLWGLFLAMGLGRWRGRPAVDSLPTLAHFLTRRAVGQTAYRARPSSPRPSGTLALPGDAARLRFLIDETSGAAILHDPHEQTLTVVAHVRHPAFVLMSPEEQAARVHGWGRALAGLGACRSGVRVQVLEITLPDAGQSIIEWWQQHRPGAGSHRAWVVKQYDELMASAVPSTSTHRTLIALTLDLRAARQHLRQAGRGLAGAVKFLRQEMTSIEAGLRNADLTLVGWLDESRLATTLRAAYDPTWAAASDSDPLGGLATSGPMALDEHWDHLQHDTGFSAVLWISEWPRVDVPAYFLHALVFQPDIRKTISLTLEPLPVEVALREIRKAKVEYLTDAAQKARLGAIADLSDSVEHADVLDRERSLVAGHADIRFTGLVAVTAPSREALEAAVAEIGRAAIQSGCETRRLFGQQARAFAAAALPIGRKVN